MKYHTIITCINFVDYLEFVYHYNKDIIHNISILSSTTDKLTKKFCLDNNIFLYQTDTFFKNNNPINRAAATNEFLLCHKERLKNDDWILFTDADIIFTDPIHRIKTLLNKNIISNNNVVSCPRKIYIDHANYPDGKHTIENIGFFGYFQFFHKSTILPELENNIAPLPENIDVSKHDMFFVSKYWQTRPDKKIYLPDVYAIHCGSIGTHWQGRKYDKKL
jgi:hypothetical protein